MPNVELTGTVVDHDPNAPIQAAQTTDGLYLQTDDGNLVQLVTDFMARQTSIAVMWSESREDFEPYLGKRITVAGYRSGRTLYSAVVVKANE